MASEAITFPCGGPPTRVNGWRNEILGFALICISMEAPKNSRESVTMDFMSYTYSLPDLPFKSKTGIMKGSCGRYFFFEGNEIQTTNYYLEPGTRLDLEASSARASNYFLNMRHETPIFFSKFHYFERAIK